MKKIPFLTIQISTEWLINRLKTYTIDTFLALLNNRGISAIKFSYKCIGLYFLTEEAWEELVYDLDAHFIPIHSVGLEELSVRKVIKMNKKSMKKLQQVGLRVIFNESAIPITTTTEDCYG